MPDHENSAVRKHSLKKYGRFLFGIALSVACVYFLLGSIKQKEVLDRFRMVNLKFLALALAVTFLSYVIRTIRWKYFFKDFKDSFFSLFRALMLGFFMNNVLPARIGELVRCHSLGSRTGQSRTFVLATVAAERLADGLTISAIFGFFFYFSNVQGEGTYYIGVVALLFILVSLLSILGLLQRSLIFRFLKYLDIQIGKKSFSFLISKIIKFVSGLEPLLQKKLVFRIVLLSLLVWGVELYAYFLISLAFGENLSIGALSLFLASVNFASLVPAAPGGVGIIESFAPHAMSKTGLNLETAVAMVIAQHAIQYIAVGIPGIYYSLRKGKIVKENI